MIDSTEWPSADEQRPTCSETVLVRREGLECAPFDLRQATAHAGLANPGSKVLGALCDGWAFAPTPMVLGGPGTVWILYLRKAPVTKRQY